MSDDPWPVVVEEVTQSLHFASQLRTDFTRDLSQVEQGFSEIDAEIRVLEEDSEIVVQGYDEAIKKLDHLAEDVKACEGVLELAPLGEKAEREV